MEEWMKIPEVKQNVSHFAFIVGSYKHSKANQRRTTTHILDSISDKDKLVICTIYVDEADDLCKSQDEEHPVGRKCVYQCYPIYSRLSHTQIHTQIHLQIHIISYHISCHVITLESDKKCRTCVIHGKARRKVIAHMVTVSKARLVLKTSGKESQTEVLITSTDQKRTSEPRRYVSFQNREMFMHPLTYQSELRVHADDDKHDKKQKAP